MGKYQNHLALDAGVSSGIFDRKQTRPGRGFFFLFRQIGKFKETSAKHGTLTIILHSKVKEQNLT